MSERRKIRLRQISPMRLGITIGVLQGLLSLLFVPALFFAGGLAAYFEPALWQAKFSPVPGVPWIFFGVGALFMPLANGVAGYLGGILIASAFNVVARWTGGVEITVEDIE
jgi:hypothetical protein